MPNPGPGLLHIRSRAEKREETVSVSGTDSTSARSFESLARAGTARTLRGSRLWRMGVEYIEESNGLSAGLWRLPGDLHLALCGEGVGTKNVLIEELVTALHGDPWPDCDPYDYYFNVTQCGVAMIVNDLITVGALPMGIIQILALFGSDWHKNELRKEAVVAGWAEACIKAGVHWSGGETAELNGLVMAPNMIIDGACWGLVPEGAQPTLPSLIEAGDEIVLVASTGIHSNGLTGARKMCSDLGYDFKLPGGRRLVDALLTPTAIYVDGLESCFDVGLEIHHSIHLTGGGLSRLVRKSPKVHYLIHKVAEPQPEFDVIQTYRNASLRDMHEALNMGQGLAVIVKGGQGEDVAGCFAASGHDAWVAGDVEPAQEHRVTLLEHNESWTEAA